MSEASKEKTASSEVQNKLSALVSSISALEEKAVDLALIAAGGGRDHDELHRHMDIQDSQEEVYAAIERMKAEKLILERAKTKALMIELAPASSAYIHGQLSAIERTIVSLDAEATNLSLSAVGGDPDAVHKLTEINARMEQAKSDRTVFERAKNKALELEQAEKDALEAAIKQQHFDDAVKKAKSLVGKCDRMDGLIQEFAKLQLEIEAEEKEVQGSYRLYGGSDGHVAKRSGLARTALVAVERIHSKLDTKISLGNVARTGWAVLLEQRKAGKPS